MHFTKYIAWFDALHFRINFGTIYILLLTKIRNFPLSREEKMGF